MLNRIWEKFKQLSIMKKVLIVLALVLPFGVAAAFAAAFFGILRIPPAVSASAGTGPARPEQSGGILPALKRW